MTGRVDLVLPVDPDRYDDALRMRILLTSLATHLQPDAVGTLLISVPDRVDPRAVQPVTWSGEPVPFRHRVVRDADLLGDNLHRKRFGNWYTQQLVKLAAADHLDSDFYVCLDSDVLLTRPTSYVDLIQDGKAATMMYPRQVHFSWWNASAELLQTDARLGEDGMSVTPAILSRDIARALLRHLEAACGDPLWYRAILRYLDGVRRRGDWQPVAGSAFPSPTEYTMYYLFAELRGLVSQYHVPSTTLWNAHQIFNASDLVDLAARLQAIESDPGRFLVVQSNLGGTPEQVWQVMSRFVTPAN